MQCNAEVVTEKGKAVLVILGGVLYATIIWFCVTRKTQSVCILAGNVPDFSGDTFVKVSLALDSSLKHDPEVSSAPGSTGRFVGESSVAFEPLCRGGGQRKVVC